LFSATATQPIQTGGIINISDKKHENLHGSFNLSMNMIPCGPNSNAALEESKNSHIVKEENNEEEEEEIKIQQVKPTG
jgi:hypothetical protein